MTLHICIILMSLYIHNPLFINQIKSNINSTIPNGYLMYELGKMMDTLRDDLLTNTSSNDPQSNMSVISPLTNLSLQVNNDVMGNNDTSALLTQIFSPVPSTSASTPLYVNMIHKSDSELKDIEHDYKLLPKLFMPVEQCSKDPRRARSIRKYNSNICSSSAERVQKGWCCVF